MRLWSRRHARVRHPILDTKQSPERLIVYVLFDSIFLLINVSNDWQTN